MSAAAPLHAVSRRALLLSGGAVLAGCASGPAVDERIVETATGRALTRAALLERLRASDLVLLGELHDNPRHHALRGALIAELAPGVAVLAEQLPRGRRVQFGADLRGSLVAAGFEPEAWRWPLHEPLFAAVARSGATLAGANATNELVRQVARGGRGALPAELAALIDAAPLAPAAQAALERDLVDGHCGHLRGTRLDAMRWAQRARDATMALALRDALAARRAAAAAAPVVFVAGNGHVRSDYGVAQLLPLLAPTTRALGVAFVESGSAPADHATDCLWITAPARRDDPCAGLAERLGPASAPR